MEVLFKQLYLQLHELNLITIVLRLSLALLFGGLIGLERERKRRPAGFRTYMLVCLGAALTMLLSQYMDLMLTTCWLDPNSPARNAIDISRMGSQVINGIGFLGAGTILVTGRQEIKGVTTAAGLWASACTGLAIGAGFYSCMVLSFLFMCLCIRVLPLMENAILSRARNMNIYMELNQVDDVGSIIQYMKSHQIRIFDMDLERGQPNQHPSVIFSVQLPPRQTHAVLMAALAGMQSVRTIEEI